MVQIQHTWYNFTHSNPSYSKSIKYDGNGIKGIGDEWYTKENASKSIESKYIARHLQGKLKIGVNEQHILINIPIQVTNDENTNEILTIKSFPYNPSMKITDVLNETMTIIHQKYYPKVYTIRYIKNKSFFVSKTISKEDNLYNQILQTSITNYQIYEISKYGIEIFIVNEYQHKPHICNSPPCEYIANKMDNNVLKCPIYRSMIHYCDFTQENYNHLLSFNHLKNEYNDKPECEQSHECQSFLNIQKGSQNIYDKCHVQLYKHPLREMRQKNISESICNIISNKLSSHNHAIYCETNEDTIKYKWNSCDGFMSALIVEVIKNGYSCDLISSNYNDISKNNIEKMVDYKMNNIRHKQINSPLNRGEMLALILYTNGKCSYDLCKSQRMNNYQKWKWFDYCLYNAIRQISRKETGEYKLYIGVKNNKIYKKKIRKGYFETYISSTWNKQIPLNWIQNDGIIIQIDKQYTQSDEIYCCDVSWVSNLNDECEVVIARSIGMENKLYANDTFILSVFDGIETDGIQSIVLNKAESYDSMCSPIV